MIILEKPITIETLQQYAQNFFGDMVKGVVDIEKRQVALDAELHSDLESLLLDNGSQQENLWGFNLYPDVDDEDFWNSTRSSIFVLGKTIEADP